MKRLAVVLALLVGFACASTAPLSNRIEMQIEMVQSADLVVEHFISYGESHKDHLTRLEAWLEAQGTPVNFDPTLMLLTSYAGVTSCNILNQCSIIIDGSIPSNGQYATLLHEATHTFHGMIVSRGGAETLAETTAYLAAQKVGLNTRRESLSYLLQIPEPIRRMTMSSFAGQIEEWADRLAKASL